MIVDEILRFKTKLFKFFDSQVAQELSLECDVGDWVAVVYNGEWYPGIVQRVRKLYSSKPSTN